MLTPGSKIRSRAQKSDPRLEKQQMRAEKPCRTQVSELQTEPYSASYGPKPFWSPPSKSVLGQTWPGPRVGPNLAGARFCSTQAKLRGSKKSLLRPKSARPRHFRTILDPRFFAWVERGPKSRPRAWGRQDLGCVHNLLDLGKIAWVAPKSARRNFSPTPKSPKSPNDPPSPSKSLQVLPSPQVLQVPQVHKF